MNLHNAQFIDLLYLIAAALFIVGLRRLGSPKTARSGNTVAGVGMIIGLAATLLQPGFDFTGVGFLLIVVGVVIGTFAGVFLGTHGQDDRDAADGCLLQRPRRWLCRVDRHCRGAQGSA